MSHVAVNAFRTTWPVSLRASACWGIGWGKKPLAAGAKRRTARKIDGLSATLCVGNVGFSKLHKIFPIFCTVTCETDIQAHVSLGHDLWNLEIMRCT